MDLSQLIKERRTVHKYEPGKPIDQAIINEAIEMSLYAPNHKLTFPWRYVQVGEQTRQKLVAAECQRREALGNFTAERKASLEAAIMNPSCVIAVLTPIDGSAYRNTEDYATISCGIQNLSLYLWDKGIASKWSTGAFTTTEATLEIIGVDSAAYGCAGFMFIGYPQKVPELAERPATSEVLRIMP